MKEGIPMNSNHMPNYSSLDQKLEEGGGAGGERVERRRTLEDDVVDVECRWYSFRVWLFVCWCVSVSIVGMCCGVVCVTCIACVVACCLPCHV